MTVSSGVRPYHYNRYPFVVGSDGEVGYSGIQFEEAMFAIVAEIDLYSPKTGSDRYFNKYLTSTLKYQFEPTSSGAQLDGTSTDNLPDTSGTPGCVNFKNYILDLRTKVSGLFAEMVIDSDYSEDAIREDYFKSYFYSTPSGAVYNWNHNGDELGSSGNIYDIDLNEVQYQPYIRGAKFKDSTSALTPMRAVSPIVPMFCTRTGGFPTVTSRELAHSKNIPGIPSLPGIVGSGYEAASNNRFLIVGDVLDSAYSRLYCTWNLLDGELKDSTYGECQQSYPRIVEGAQSVIGSGLGEFTPGNISVNSGLYQIQLWRASSGIPFSAVSGDIGFWPKANDYDISIFGYKGQSPLDMTRASGLHIANEMPFRKNASGLLMYSVFNYDTLWQRYFDQTSYQTTNMATPKRWLDIGGSVLFTPTEIRVARNNNFNSSPPFIDESISIVDYNRSTLDIGTATETNTWTVSDPLVLWYWVDTGGHTPESGIDMSSWPILQGRETSDNAVRCPVIDGSNLHRGNILPNFLMPLIADSRPDIQGVINGNLYGISHIDPVGTPPPYIWYHLVVENKSPGTFPRSVASGDQLAAYYHIYNNEAREMRYSTELIDDFEPMNSDTNFSIPFKYLINIQGTDLDIGDGSALINFNARPKGTFTTTSFIGRVVEATSGGLPYLHITEWWGPTQGMVNWIGEYT